MAIRFGIVDLTSGSPLVKQETPLQGIDLDGVDLESLRTQLEQIRDELTPVMDAQEKEQGFQLTTMELDLTVGLEGKLWFIAKGSGEASLKLTWSRGS